MNDVYASNLVNLIENAELYHPDLAQFILQRVDINELNKEEFHINLIGISLTTTCNFKGFIYHKTIHESEKGKALAKQILTTCGSQLDEASFNMKIPKVHSISVNGFHALVNPRGYIDKLQSGELSALRTFEQRLILNVLLSQESYYLRWTNHEDTRALLHEIIHDNAQYLRKKSPGTPVFLQNRDLKKAMLTMPMEQRYEAYQMKPSEVIAAYLNRLIDARHFDLSDQLQGVNGQQIVAAFKEHAPQDAITWFDKLIYQGTKQKAHELLMATISLGQYVRGGSQEQKKVLPIRDMVALVEKIHGLEDFDDKQRTVMLMATIVVGHKPLYVKLRSMIDLPQTQSWHEMIQRARIGSQAVSEIEKEIFTEKLQANLETKTTISRHKL